MRRNELWLRAIAFCAVLLPLQGCPGTIDDPQAFLDGRNPTDSGPQEDAMVGGCDVEAIFESSATGCAGAACHAGGGASAPNLEMSNWANLSDTSIFCPDTPYVTPGNPEASAVYLKLLPDGERGPCTGNRMPSTRPALPDDEIACVRSWIEGMQ